MLDAVGIVSTNPEKSVAFYEVLGVRLNRFENTGHYEATTTNGLRLLLDSESSIRSFDPDFTRVRGNGIAICFKQESPGKVDEIFKKCLEAGGASIKEPWDAFWGHRYACVADPDGYQIDLFASL